MSTIIDIMFFKPHRKDDKNIAPGVSQYYYDLLKKKKLQVKIHIIEGSHGLRCVPSIGPIIGEYIN